MKYIKIFTNSLQILDELEKEQIADLFLAIRDYSEGREIKLTGVMKALFLQFKQGFDKSEEVYNQLVKNGKKGGRPKAKQSEENQMKPNESKGKANESKGKYEEEEEEEERNIDNNSNELLSCSNGNLSEDFSFENFYSIYPKKVNKKKAKQRFQKISFQILPVVFKKLKAYCEKRKKEATELQYIPGPDVWINNEKRNDEIKISLQPENEVLEFINQANLDDSQKERVRIIWRQRQIDNKPRTLDILREVIKKLKLNQI